MFPSAVSLKQNASSSRLSKGLGLQVLSFPLKEGMGIGLVKSDFFGFFKVLVRQLVDGCGAVRRGGVFFVVRRAMMGGGR